MQPDFWDLPKELEQEREREYEAFQALYNEKVERIQRNYSRELTEAQFALLQKDENLLLATESFLNVLLLQIDRLCRVNEGLNNNLTESVDDLQKVITNSTYKATLSALIAKHKLISKGL